MLNLNSKDIKTLKEKGIKPEGNMVIPAWESNKNEIHPALDFSDNTIFISQFMNYLDEDKEKEYLTMFTSNKKFIVIKNEEDWSEKGYKPLYIPNKLQNRWSSKSIQKYLNGSCPKVKIYDVYYNIRKDMKKYIDLPDPNMYDLLTCWAIGTYFHPLFNTYPYIFLNAMKRSGKTKLLTFMSCICFNAKFSLSLTPATLFRLVQGNRCTLLMDEEEKITSKDIGEIRSMLLAGYKKGIMVPRAQEQRKKKNWEVSEYEVYAPKMLANISGIEDVLEDRCITLVLLRTKNRLVGNREINIKDEEWQQIRDNLYINLLSNWKEVRNTYEVMSNTFLSEVSEQSVVSVGEKRSTSKNKKKNQYIETATLTTQTTLNTLLNKIKGVKSRDLELWLPILTIGMCIDEKIFDNLLELCIKLVREKETEDATESTDLVLISCLAEYVDKDDWYEVKNITSRLRAYMGLEDNENKWVNNKWVGRAMKRLGFNEKKRMGTGVRYRLVPKKVQDLSERSGMALEKFIKKEQQKSVGDNNDKKKK